jgi:hypothetical protein
LVCAHTLVASVRPTQIADHPITAIDRMPAMPLTKRPVAHISGSGRWHPPLAGSNSDGEVQSPRMRTNSGSSPARRIMAKRAPMETVASFA